MRALLTLTGVLMIAASAFVFMYPGVSWNQREQVAQLGDIHVTAETQKTVMFTPMLGGGLLIGGVVLLLIGARRK